MQRVLLLLVVAVAKVVHVSADAPVEPSVTLTNEHARDQDDMCIWLNPHDPGRSTVITSDKSANKLFVYDLAGALLQAIDVAGKPGNIDIRYGFPVGSGSVDLVGLNEREGGAILLYAIDPEHRTLSRIDDGAIRTGPNYGFSLYRSAKSGAYYGFTVSEDEGGGVEQYAFEANEDGTVSGRRVRQWPHGKSEGCVADDETGSLYVGEESVGIWKFSAEPEDSTDGELIAAVGSSDLAADVEGVAIAYGENGEGHLVVSSQGNSRYVLFERRPPHAFVGSFTVAGASDTDGVDILNVSLGSSFPHGILTLHNGAAAPHPILVCPLERLPFRLGMDPVGPRGRRPSP